MKSSLLSGTKKAVICGKHVCEAHLIKEIVPYQVLHKFYVEYNNRNYQKIKIWLKSVFALETKLSNHKNRDKEIFAKHVSALIFKNGSGI